MYGLGNLLIEAQNTTAALPYTQRAISHYKKLVDNYSALFLINLASNQLNLGIIYNRQDNHNASIESYSSTLKSLALVKQNHEVFKCSLVTEEEYKNLVNYYTALAHTNLGIIYIETDQVEKAYSNLNKSLLLSRSLAKKTKQKYLDIHISTLKNMGLYYTSKNNYNKALEYYKQALQHLQSYSKINRHENKNLLARTYQSIGNLFYKMHNYPLAEKNELKALELLRELSAANPSIYSAEQKQILQDLACVYMKLEDYEKVKLYGKEFIQLQGKSDTLTKNNLENLQVHNFLATLYIGQEEYEKSLDYLQQGLIIAKNLATIRPEKYKIQIAKAYNNLGVVYKGMENFEKSIENWEKALVLYDELSSENPDKYLLDLAQSSKNLGFTYSQVFKFKEAIKLNQKALESYQQLAKTQSKSFEVDVISCLQTLIAIHINSYLESKDPNTLTTIKHRFEQTDLLHKKQQNNPNLAPYRNHLKALKNYLNHLLLSNKEKIHFLKEDINKTKNQSVDKKSLSEKYAQLAWYYLLENDAQSANTNSQTALSYHPCLHANIAHAFSRLISGEFQKAQATLDIYIKEPYPQDYRYKTCKELYLAQIKELEQVGISHPNLGKMKSYLLQN